MDADGDGFGDGFGIGTTCDEAPEGYALTSTDCDDTDAMVNPDGTEVCGVLQTTTVMDLLMMEKIVRRYRW